MSFLAMLEMYLHKIILASYKLINVFISPSKFLISKCNEWKIDVSGFKHIYNFVDLEKIKPVQELGHGLIYFGRLAEEKGIMTVLEAMKLLPEINLMVVGSGPEENKIKKFIKENDLKNVTLLGYKSGNELYNLIGDARLIIAPSIWYENNPISILEAFALGKPVIGTDLAGIKELVIAEKTGLLFEAGSSEDLKRQIAKFYFDERLITEMGKNCQEFIKENCDPEAHIKKIIEVYRGLKK
jgi:glycosyltransferase involved in cell wall biosynthesis